MLGVSADWPYSRGLGLHMEMKPGRSVISRLWKRHRLLQQQPDTPTHARTPRDLFFSARTFTLHHIGAGCGAGARRATPPRHLLSLSPLPAWVQSHHSVLISRFTQKLLSVALGLQSCTHFPGKRDQLAGAAQQTCMCRIDCNFFFLGKIFWGREEREQTFLRLCLCCLLQSSSCCSSWSSPR